VMIVAIHETKLTIITNIAFDSISMYEIVKMLLLTRSIIVLQLSRT